MQFGILGHPESWYCRDLQRAAEERGHRSVVLDFERLTASVGGTSPAVCAGAHDLTKFDAIIVRTMPPGSLEQVVYRMDLLGRLQAQGVVVLNTPRALECAVDKYLTTARLAEAGLPTPVTVVCEHAEEALEAFERLGGDVVVKPIFGSEGRGILRVSDPDLALRTFRTLERLQAVLYLQEFIDHGGSDLRVMVLDGRVLGGMRRHSPDDFRTNISRNGRAEAATPDEFECEAALRASAAVGTRVAGIDILTDSTGQRYVIEVNAVPGWRAFQRATGHDVAALIVESLERGAGVQTAARCNLSG
jgi:ribosomal protein S6--L-glutamate ligase